MACTEILDALKTAITHKPPFCIGAIALSSDDGEVFYKVGADSDAKWIDLANATETQLESLTRACSPATFGLDKQDVLDESYRKAGKMDTDNFATKFDVAKLRIVDRIRTQLLYGEDESKFIKAELYKLNVYGKGSFFKSHKDTPRSDKMFASLVVVFPTLHEGGDLILRHRGEEWTFNAREVTRDTRGPAIGYIAFYSDVDHEVTLMKSGYRVTLTYNLYLENGISSDCLPSSITPVAPSDLVFRTALSNALLDPSFLPNGGVLGFGLSFMYPITIKYGATPLKKLLSRLKGSDAVTKRVCDQLSLNASLKAIYKAEVDVRRGTVMHHIMADEIDDLSQVETHDDIDSVLRTGGKVIYDLGSKPPKDWNNKRVPVSEAVAVLWVTPLNEYSHFKSQYIAYGNEACLAHVYGDVCLVVEVGPSGCRETKGPEDKDLSQDESQDDSNDDNPKTFNQEVSEGSDEDSE